MPNSMQDLTMAELVAGRRAVKRAADAVEFDDLAFPALLVAVAAFEAEINRRRSAAQ